LRYTFGEYSLETSRRELRRGASLVSTTPQVFDLVEYLIRNRERLVSRGELIAAIWKGRVVSDSALTTRLNALRRAIGDSGKSQRLIKTIARRGFRFVGAVREERRPDSVVTPKTSWELPACSTVSPGYPSIAVLPFADIPEGSYQELVAEGLAEDVLTELAKRHWLVVVSRHLSSIYGQNAVELRRIGEELGVRYVLEGSVRALGDRVRITSRLFNATTHVLVWGARYERAGPDTFAAHDEIVEAMAAAIANAIVHADSGAR
jgi:TolB-like protein